MPAPAQEPAQEPRPSPADDATLFAAPPPAGGCASGECLPDAAPPDGELTLERWRAVVDQVRAASSRHGIALSFGRVAKLAPGEVTLYFPPAAAFHRTVVFAQSGKATIEKLLAAALLRPTRLLSTEVPPAGTEAASIGETEARQRVQREKDADEGIRGHPSVRAVLRVLGGEIEHVQVLDQERPPARPVESTEE